VAGAGLADDDDDPRKAIKIQDTDSASVVLAKGMSAFILETIERMNGEMMADIDPTNIPRQYIESPFPMFGYLEKAWETLETATKLSDEDYFKKVAEKVSFQVPGLGLIRDTDFIFTAGWRAMFGVDEEEATQKAEER
jgi:hypothetical protein